MTGIGWRAGVAFLAGLLLVGCGSSSGKPDGGAGNRGNGGSGGTGGSGGGSASGCADYASKFCAEIQTCAPGFLKVLGFGDLAGCQRVYLASCNDSLVAPSSAWTSALAEQCANGYAGMNCATFLGQGGIPPACLIRGGTVPNGGPCSTPWQCASGRCSLTTLVGCGTCTAVVPLGQPCTPNEFLGGTCADDLVCALTPTSGTSTVCAAGVSIGGACADTAVCPVNGYCNLNTHVCTRLPAAGQSCDANAISYCDPTQTGALCDATTSTCLPITMPSADAGCGPDGGAGPCPTSAGDGGACAPADICNISSGCFDLGACAAFVCAGGDAGVAPAVALERTRPSRLRRPRPSFPN
jgi:hypothetical protein